MRRIPRGTDEKLFTSLYRKMLDTGYERPPWDKLNLKEVTEEALKEYQLAWAARASSEYRSMVVFAEIIARIPEVGLPLEASCAASRLLQDEARHTELCAEFAEHLGGTVGECLNPSELRLVDDHLPAHLFIARWTTSMFCIGESASVGLLHSLDDNATDLCAKVVIQTLLRDEILHDRFGWALARTIIPKLTDDEREWLSADLAFALAHYDRVDADCMRPDGGEVPAGPEASKPNLGVVPRHYFARAFYDRLDRVILPGLASLGLDAYEAWALRKETENH